VAFSVKDMFSLKVAVASEREDCFNNALEALEQLLNILFVGQYLQNYFVMPLRILIGVAAKDVLVASRPSLREAKCSGAYLFSFLASMPAPAIPKRFDNS
jgi:hypothetical protein